MKKSPKLPREIPTSTYVGRYVPHTYGSKSWAGDVTMITNRSSHIPTFTSRDTTRRYVVFLRRRLAKSVRGTRELQKIMAHVRYRNSPTPRYRNASFSKTFSPYDARPNSTM